MRGPDWGTSTTYRDLIEKTIDNLETNTRIDVRARGLPLNQIKPIVSSYSRIKVFFFLGDWIGHGMSNRLY